MPLPPIAAPRTTPGVGISVVVGILWAEAWGIPKFPVHQTLQQEGWDPRACGLGRSEMAQGQGWHWLWKCPLTPGKEVGSLC